VPNLNYSNFNQSVIGSKDIWIADFYAPWCPHCQAFEPELAKAAAELKGKVKIEKIDSAVELDLKNRFDIHSFP
jgi:protein disulfide-isomerase A6